MKDLHHLGYMLFGSGVALIFKMPTEYSWWLIGIGLVLVIVTDAIYRLAGLERL